MYTNMDCVAIPWRPSIRNTPFVMLFAKGRVEAARLRNARVTRRRQPQQQFSETDDGLHGGLLLCEKLKM